MAAVKLRALARNAMLSAGGRGFMRFAPEGGALLVTDALRRCGDEAQARRLIGALEAAGFLCEAAEGLVLLTPGDALLGMVCVRKEKLPAVNWERDDYAEEAFAARLARCDAIPLTRHGRQLVLEALRLTGTPGRSMKEGIDALRARAAVMLRTGDRSGMREAGAVLINAMQRRAVHEA